MFINQKIAAEDMNILFAYSNRTVLCHSIILYTCSILVVHQIIVESWYIQTHITYVITVTSFLPTWHTTYTYQLTYVYTHELHSQIYWSCHYEWCGHCQRTPTQDWKAAEDSSLSRYPQDGW